MSLDLSKFVREIADFPKPGILFRDINPLLANPTAWSEVVEQLAAMCKQLNPDLIVGIESRGFLIGSCLAYSLNKGFVPVRKIGKLPGKILSIEYDLEYGKDTLEVQMNSIPTGARILIIDDLLATGGTALATAKLVEKTGANIIGFAFIVELLDLAGRDKLPDKVPINVLMSF